MKMNFLGLFLTVGILFICNVISYAYVISNETLYKLNENNSKSFNPSMFPRGTMVMIGNGAILDEWMNLSGTGFGLFQGWHMCFGNYGTSDLRGRVPVGRNKFDYNSDYYKSGSMGGNEFHMTTTSSSSLVDLRQPFNVVVYIIRMAENNNGQNLPFGTMVMIGNDSIDSWFDSKGKGFGEYEGWYLCNGRNNTPDMRGRVAVGRNRFDYSSDYYKVGSKGGKEFHETGLQAGMSIDVRQPFYVVVYIIYLGESNNRTALPYGTIIMIGNDFLDRWFDLKGKGSGEYKGWYFCDGQNGTPDLRGHVTVGRDFRYGDYTYTGNTGGEEIYQISRTLVDIRQPFYVVNYLVYSG